MESVDEIAKNRMPARGRDVLDRLLATRQVTADGVAFLTAACDPFHDNKVNNIRGFPDCNACRSDVQVVTYTYNVSSPFTDTTVTWDLHVPFIPLTPCFTQGALGKEVAEEYEQDMVILDSIDNKIYYKKFDSSKDFHYEVSESRTYGSGMEYYKRVRGKTGIEFVLIKPSDISQTTTKVSESKDLQSYKQRLLERKKARASISSQQYFRSTIDEFGHIGQSGSGLMIGSGWNMIAVGNGEDWQTASDGVQHPQVQIDPQFTSGAWRLLSSGCEVVNTTSELYKGGSVTAFRSPSINVPATITIPIVGALAVRSIGLLPPSTQDEAALYPDSITWGAEDGSYQVATLNGKDNPYYTPVPGCAGLISPSSFTDLSGGAGWIGYFPSFAGGGTTETDNLSASLSNGLPFDTCGTVYSGLNGNTTMQVTARYWFERHPTIADPDLLTLSKACAHYDPVILELLSRVVQAFPAACKVAKNPQGEWWTEILQIVGNWFPKIGGALGSMGIPLVKPIGRLIGEAANNALKGRQQANDSKALVEAAAQEKVIKPKAAARREPRSMKAIEKAVIKKKEAEMLAGMLMTKSARKRQNKRNKS